MTPHSLGKISVTTPGTPVQATSTSTTCARIHFEATGNTGTVYLGISTLAKPATGVLKRFEPGDSYDLWSQSQEALDSQNLDSYYLDADVANDGLLISYWV